MNESPRGRVQGERRASSGAQLEDCFFFPQLASAFIKIQLFCSCHHCALTSSPSSQPSGARGSHTLSVAVIFWPFLTLTLFNYLYQWRKTQKQSGKRCGILIPVLWRSIRLKWQNVIYQRPDAFCVSLLFWQIIQCCYRKHKNIPHS